MTDNPILAMALQIAKAMLWLFTAQKGLICLGIGVLCVLLVHLSKALKERDLLLAASGRRGGITSVFVVMFQEFVSIAGWVVANIPILISAVAILGLVVALSGTVTKLSEFLSIEQRIREYDLVLKNLERRHKVARVKCLKQKNGKTTLSLIYFDQNGSSVEGSEERVEILGADIYIDAFVLNFAYSGIASGEQRNLAFPHRVFSDKVPQKNGVPLKIASFQHIPYFFERSAYQVYGMEKSVYDSRLNELLELSKNAENARKVGVVRSLYGNAVHTEVKEGDTFFIWVEQSGGLTIKNESRF